MSDVRLTEAPQRAHLIERLRPRLSELVPGLHLIAEDLLGAESRIDFVGVEPTGRVVLILMPEAGHDLAAVGEALAQRAWVEPRVRDWIQLAPNIGARPVAGVRVVLLCPDFSAQTEAAVAAVDAGAISLARYKCLRNGADLHILLEAGATGPPPPTASASEAPSRRDPAQDLPPFRTGLTDEDLGLTPEEHSALE